jgi:hypothetical protein
MVEGTPGEQLVQRRMRTRLIRYFDLVASFDNQVAFETAVPFVPAPVEVIEMYGDCVPLPSLLDQWGAPVFTVQELVAIRSFSRVLDEVCARVPELPSWLQEAMRLPEWEVLRREAEVALRVLMQRGLLPEDAESEAG